MQDDAEVNSLSAGAQYDNVTASICGLEISIRNISAQEIDVIFPGNQYCNINNPGRTQFVAVLVIIVIYFMKKPNYHGRRNLTGDSLGKFSLKKKKFELSHFWSRPPPPP